MILVLNYKKGYTAQDKKRYKPKTLIKCELCNKTREMDKTQAIKSNRHRCHKCYCKTLKPINRRRVYENDYEILAFNKNLIWLNKKLPESIGHSTLWKCTQCNYIWSASYRDIKKKPYKLNEFNYQSVCRVCQNKRKNINYISPKKIIEWSKFIKSEYNNQCQKCGDTIKLQSHHINNKRDNPTLTLEKNNGICLCFECHKKFHNIFGKRKTNLNKLLEFLSDKFCPNINNNFTKLYLDQFFI